MLKKKPFSYKKYHTTLYAFRGKVADVQQERTVHTHISGGEGYIDPKFGGSIDPVRSKNTEHLRKHFFLVDETANEEREVSLSDWDFPVRVGHDVGFAWLVWKGRSEGNIIYIANYNLKHEEFNYRYIPHFHPRKTFLYRCFFWIFVPLISLIVASLITVWADVQSDLVVILYIFATFCVIGSMVTVLHRILFATEYKNAAAASQQIIDDVQQLAREALAEKV